MPTTLPQTGRPIVFYDGVCGLCNRLNQFVLRRDRKARFQFAALQSAFARETLSRYGRDPEDLDTLYLVTDYGTSSERLFWKSRAALRVLRELGGAWSWTRVLSLLPTALLDLGYDIIARLRYRVFGKSESCVIPRPEQRDRFIEFE